MENKSNNSNNILLIIVGLIIVAGISLVVGFSFGKGNSESENISGSSSVNQKENQTDTTINIQEQNKLDSADALAVVKGLYNEAMDYYTFDALDNCAWRTDNNACVNLTEFWDKNKDGGFIKITNYNEVMAQVFTTNGLTQFENFMKNDLSEATPFIKKENGNTFVNVPTSGFYAGYSTENLKVVDIKEKEIKATIDVIDAFAKSEGSKNAVVTKNIIIKKENNKWLVEEFAIPMH